MHKIVYVFDPVILSSGTGLFILLLPLHIILHPLHPTVSHLCVSSLGCLVCYLLVGFSQWRHWKERERRREIWGHLLPTTWPPPPTSMVLWVRSQWFSNFSTSESLGCFGSDSVGCCRAWEFIFLIDSQVLLMLLVQGPQFEKHSFKATVPRGAACIAQRRLSLCSTNTVSSPLPPSPHTPLLPQV